MPLSLGAALEATTGVCNVNYGLPLPSAPQPPRRHVARVAATIVVVHQNKRAAGVGKSALLRAALPRAIQPPQLDARLIYLDLHDAPPPTDHSC